MPRTILHPAGWPVLLALMVASCSEAPPPPANAENAGDRHAHAHVPPHGGVPVVLGDEAYHIEFVRDPSSESMEAFILDGHMEEFVRIRAPSFLVRVLLAGQTNNLVFAAVSRAETGEAVGNTATFRAEADWLATTEQFDAEIVSLEIRSRHFAGVPFRFADGNESAH